MPSSAAIAWGDWPWSVNSNTCADTLCVLLLADISTVSCGAAALGLGRALVGAAAAPAAVGCTPDTAVIAAIAPLVGSEDDVIHPVLET